MTEYARITYPKGGVSILPLSERDIESVAKLYREIEITAQNCSERLSAESPRSFRHIGGMFLIQDQKSLSKILGDPMCVSCVAKDCEGAVAAFLWSSLLPAGAACETIAYFDGYKHLERGVEDARKAGKLALGGEILVSTGNIHPHITLPLLHTQFRLLQKRGIEIIAGEIYRVTAYRYGGREMKLDLLNERSKAVFARAGAVFAGEMPEKKIFSAGFQVAIRPLAALCDVAKCLETTRLKMSSENLIYNQLA